VAGTLSLAALAALHGSNLALYGRLTGRALPFMVLAGLCGLAVVILLAAGRFTGARGVAALGVAAVIWGWGAAQYPVLLPGTAVTLSNAGAPDDTLVALVVLAIVALLLIGPAFILLYSLQGRRLLGTDRAAAPPGRRSR
jgi:cytochrome d ubiquinol oxidase subunit II